jgi:ketosteroid isomerase-like protein
MSAENVEIVRCGHEAFERGDLPGLLEVMDPEIVCYTAPPLPDAAEYRGHDGMLQWAANWIEGFADYVQRAESYYDAGDYVIATVYQHGRGEQSGAPVEQHFWFLHEVREGKLVRIGVHVTREQALEAAGLSE